MIATLITRTREGASYVAGVVTTIIGGLSLNDIAVIVGIGCTLGTFIINWYYKRQENKRAQEKHDLEMR
ncbi:phage holin family protein [Escherichia coli]|nr:phage holin family protein [Escherichia coli]